MRKCSKRKPILNASKTVRIRTKAEIAQLNAPSEPFDCNGSTEVFDGFTKGWDDTGFGVSAEPTLLSDAYALYPGTNHTHLYPAGLDERERTSWLFSMFTGVEDRDRNAPRWPRLLVLSRAKKLGRTPHRIEWEMYGPTECAYCPRLSIEQHYELEAKVPQVAYRMLREGITQSRDNIEDTTFDDEPTEPVTPILRGGRYVTPKPAPSTGAASY